MKLFYYLYGVISMLFLFVITFDYFAYEVLDDYYIELLKHQYNQAWGYTNLVTTFAFVLFSIIWIYHQGVNSVKEIAKQYEEEEKLLNNKIEENE